MGQNSAIEWTDVTWNPTTGCTRVSEGCRNCYAFQLHDQRHAAHQAGKKVPDQYAKPFKELQLFEDRLTDPLGWKKPRRVFVNSMSDLFHKDVPDEFLDRVFAVMALCPQHTFQVLTKRPERMRAFLADRDHDYLTETFGLTDGPLTDEQKAAGWMWDSYRDADGFKDATLEYHGKLPLPNVWLGVSVEHQAAADERIPLLLQTPAAVRFLSCEPLLGPVEFSDVTRRSDAVSQLGKKALDGIHWVIVGGESGPGARPCDAVWVRSIVNQCQAARVPAFVKQLGANIIDRNDAGFEAENEVWAEGPDAGKPTDPRAWPTPVDVEHDLDGTRDGYQGAPVRVHLHDRKGGDPLEWPEDLRVRQFPEVSRA